MMTLPATDEDAMDDVENALPFRHSTVAARYNSTKKHNHGNWDSSTQPYPRCQETPKRDTFQDAFVVDNRVRTPMYPIPWHYQQQRPSTRKTTHQSKDDSQADVQVDSATLLPKTSAGRKSPLTSTTVPTPQVYVQSLDETSAITTSPALRSTAPSQYDQVVAADLEDRCIGSQSAHSAQPSCCLLHGEDISVASSGISDRTSSGDLRYSYSPCELNDVELQGPDGNRVDQSPGEVLRELSTIGGPASDVSFKSQQSKSNSRRPSIEVSKLIRNAGSWTHNQILPVGQKAKRILHQYRPPPSPNTKNMSSLEYLRNAHKAKVDMLSNVELEDHFDFALVLTAQNVYGYWADLLDFRAEQLGEEAAQALLGGASTASEKDSSDVECASNASSSQHDTTEEQKARRNEEEQRTPQPVVHNFSTPCTGMHQRRGKQRRGLDSATAETPDVASSRNASSMRERTYSFSSPYRVLTSTQKTVVPRMSLFERALGSVEFTPSHLMPGINGGNQNDGANRIVIQDATPSTVVSTNRRRWGPHSLNGALQAPNCMMSPPVRSLSHGGSSAVVPKRATSRPRANTGNCSVLEENGGGDDSESTEEGPNTLRVEDIPSQVIPRGIAARTNGMLQFLSALKRGIVVRRHRCGMEPVFCKIISNDGGDTVCFEYVEKEDAMNAFKEQRVRYNRNDAASRAHAQPWSYVDESEDETVFQNHNFSVPDFIAAKQFREKMLREKGMRRKVSDVVAKVTRSGQFRACDMVAVHPARHEDPRSDLGKLGTSSLRRSKVTFSTELTFSVVCRVIQRFPGSGPKNIETFENKWYKGEGSDVQFKYLDFEAATEGEYWLIFRGFLLLHRDAAGGRFAAHRTAGIGSHFNRLELEQREQADLDVQNTLHRDEFCEPITPSLLEKAIVKLRKIDTTYMKGYVLSGAVPPPSDYFLGFRSPGTQIWSRLRQAGLETLRVYNVDTKSVMIKVRCPEDRLMDVAEVLRVKLKTRQGKFASFREDSIEQFLPISDDLEAQFYHDAGATLFRSSHRQTIIDFIIGSRIRDSGAELGQTTELGKMITARVPLHVPRKLEALYAAWCYYWRKENWRGRDGCSLRIENDAIISTLNSGALTEPDRAVLEDHIPNAFYRFFVGGFFQPLDSVEEYFGEKVAFHFAWLQHCSTHLIVLTCAGLIVSACMLATQNWDHPIRPYWSVFVMLWSFTVLINWRKRSNFLAYRWGTIDYKEQETTRPQFKGQYTIDEITQEWVVTYPKWKRWLKYLISLPLTLGFTIGSLIIILMFHANRDLQMAQYMEQANNLNAEPFTFTFSIKAIGQTGAITGAKIRAEYLMDPKFLMIVAGFPSILGLCLPLLNFTLMNVSIMLNDFENYRTHSEYRTNLIIKVFSFRFICYFASLYYYAFVSIGSKQAIENGILRVSTGVLVYTTVAHWWGLFLQIYFPLLIYKIRMRLRRIRLLKELADVELQENDLLQIPNADKDDEATKQQKLRLINKRLLLEQAQDETWLECLRPEHDSFPEYIAAVVQFAYVTCFSAVLPITPLICLINYQVSMRLDAYKVCKVRRRPLSEKTGGMGVWEHLLHIVVVIAVLTNCWLLGFTHYQFIRIGEKVGVVGSFIGVVVAEHLLLLIKYVMHATCSTLPESVKNEIRREQHEQTRQRNETMHKQRRSQYMKSSSYRIPSQAKILICSGSDGGDDFTEADRTRMSEF